MLLNGLKKISCSKIIWMFSWVIRQVTFFSIECKFSSNLRITTRCKLHVEFWHRNAWVYLWESLLYTVSVICILCLLGIFFTEGFRAWWIESLMLESCSQTSIYGFYSLPKTSTLYHYLQKLNSEINLLCCLTITIYHSILCITKASFTFNETQIKFRSWYGVLQKHRYCSFMIQSVTKGDRFIGV